MLHCWQYPKMLWILSALHHNLCHWDHNPNLWILIPVPHLDCVSSAFPLDYGSHAILWIVFLVSTLDSVYISPNCLLNRPSALKRGLAGYLGHHGGGVQDWPGALGQVQMQHRKGLEGDMGQPIFCSQEKMVRHVGKWWCQRQAVAILSSSWVHTPPDGWAVAREVAEV